ncbi:MFS transporter [Bifidobacterium platyrrhinorum]|uniref:MFS transporter n=1 Tax=Bifidobacterium platyrrhinorum TaxID=2661628 RepID=A0A6L9STG6_9BIFI|nr:MFS transporter [Bifidobacterium platyrrhinorum]NEG54832.1 MFS transporter [Bifidobacterium platyrrhinorum]
MSTNISSTEIPTPSQPPASTLPQPPASPQDTTWKQRVALLLTGQTLSLLGSSVVQYAIFWHLVMQSDSGSVMASAMIVTCLPQAVVSMFGGVWADRWNRKLLIMLPDAVIAGLTVLLAAAFATGWANLSLIMLVLALRSAGGGVQTPAVQSFIPQITPESKLMRVNSVNGTLQSANQIAAPALAAVLVTVLPLWAILFVDVTTAVIGIGFTACIRVPGSAGVQETGGETAGETVAVPDAAARVIRDLREGFAYTWRSRRIRSVILGNALVCFINVAPMNLTLLLINREYRHDDLNLGFAVLSSTSDKLAANELAWSIGMILGGLLMSSIGAKRIHDCLRAVAVGFVLIGITTAGLGLAPTLPVFLIIDFLTGLATPLAASPAFTMLQQESSEDMQGRVFGLLNAFSTFGTPLGMMVFGPLSDMIDVRLIFIIGGALTIPLGCWLAHVGAVTRRPSSPEEGLPNTGPFPYA